MYRYAVGGRVCRQRFRPVWSMPPSGGSLRAEETGFLQSIVWHRFATLVGVRVQGGCDTSCHPSLLTLTMQQQSQPTRQRRRPSLSLPRSASINSPTLTQTVAAGGIKPAATQRTSKTHQKLVELPSDAQTRPLHAEPGEDDEIHGYETDTGVRMREHKSATERMTKAERRRAGCRRITAYWLADGFRMKLLASFLKREHNVVPRSFDEALYVVRPTDCPFLPPPYLISHMWGTTDRRETLTARCITSHYSPVTAPRPKYAPRFPRSPTLAVCRTCRRSKRTGTRARTSSRAARPSRASRTTGTSPPGA